MSFLISLTLGGNLFIRATCFFYQIAICKISHQIISRELLNCTHGTLPAAEHATFLAACLSQGSSSGWADERSFGLCGPHLCFKAMGQIGHNILQIYGWPTMLRIWQNYNGSTYNNSEIQTHPNSRQSDAKHVCRSSSRKMLTKKKKNINLHTQANDNKNEARNITGMFTTPLFHVAKKNSVKLTKITRLIPAQSAQEIFPFHWNNTSAGALKISQMCAVGKDKKILQLLN